VGRGRCDEPRIVHGAPEEGWRELPLVHGVQVQRGRQLLQQLHLLLRSTAHRAHPRNRARAGGLLRGPRKAGGQGRRSEQGAEAQSQQAARGLRGGQGACAPWLGPGAPRELMVSRTRGSSQASTHWRTRPCCRGCSSLLTGVHLPRGPLEQTRSLRRALIAHHPRSQNREGPSHTLPRCCSTARSKLRRQCCDRYCEVQGAQESSRCQGTHLSPLSIGQLYRVRGEPRKLLLVLCPPSAAGDSRELGRSILLNTVNTGRRSDMRETSRACRVCRLQPLARRSTSTEVLTRCLPRCRRHGVARSSCGPTARRHPGRPTAQRPSRASGTAPASTPQRRAPVGPAPRPHRGSREQALGRQGLAWGAEGCT